MPALTAVELYDSIAWAGGTKKAVSRRPGNETGIGGPTSRLHDLACRGTALDRALVPLGLGGAGLGGGLPTASAFFSHGDFLGGWDCGLSEDGSVRRPPRHGHTV